MYVERAAEGATKLGEVYRQSKESELTSTLGLGKVKLKQELAKISFKRLG